MKFSVLLFLVAFISESTFANITSPVKKNVNATTSTVKWKGYKVTGSHEGDIKVKSGNLSFEGEMLKGGEIVIDMNSINCTDLDANSGKTKLEGHLKSDDFFGTTNYPTAKIVITKVSSKGVSGEYKVTANVTIKQTTKEIKFDAIVLNGVATANIKIDRSDFDIKYGSGSFFDNLGDKTIYDEFDLNVSLKF